MIINYKFSFTTVGTTHNKGFTIGDGQKQDTNSRPSNIIGQKNLYVLSQISALIMIELKNSFVHVISFN